MFKTKFVKILSEKHYTPDYIEKAWDDCHEYIQNWFADVIMTPEQFNKIKKQENNIEKTVINYLNCTFDNLTGFEKEYMLEEMMGAAIEDNKDQIFS